MPLTFNSDRLPESDVYQVLSNPRRREALRCLRRRPGAVSVRELSELVATAESGRSPAPRTVRETVYVSLHQTHLPKLDELDLITYDRDRREVRPLDRARQLGPYMEAVTRFGVTWGGYYRALGIVGLFAVVAALGGLPGFALVDPLLWASGALGLFAASSAYQLWTGRGRRLAVTAGALSPRRRSAR